MTDQSNTDKVKERGLIFCEEMIQAFLREQNPKTMTRRIKGLEPINETPNDWELPVYDEVLELWCFEHKKHINLSTAVKCPYAVGDKIYVKEAWATLERYDNRRPSRLPDKAPIVPIFYKAGFDYPIDKSVPIVIRRWYSRRFIPERLVLGRWRSGRFMPKRFARIWREIVAVRCERLQEISRRDACLEGIVDKMEWQGQVIKDFEVLWDRLHPKHPWASNPFVWVLSLEEVKK